MSTLTIPFATARRRYFQDEDGAMATTKTEDEVLGLTLDWTDLLASGETISTSVWTDDGVTTTVKSISGLTTIATVSKTGGETVNKITTSAGRILERVVRFYAPGYEP